jgi:non-ribosomal peptide synthetase component F
VIDQAPEALAGVRQLLTGGEALSVPHVHRALAHLPETTLINGYGPTENTTFTFCYPIPPAFAVWKTPGVVGNPNESVNPVTKALPAGSRAMPRAESVNSPPT